MCWNVSWLKFAIAPIVVWAMFWLKANVWFRLYPAIMGAIALGAFAFSLFRRPLVEKFAIMMGERLDDRGRRYCRRVTVAWTIFLSLHLVVTIATVFAPMRCWAIYNGGIAYALLALMFGGEWLIRRRIRNG